MPGSDAAPAPADAVDAADADADPVGQYVSKRCAGSVPYANVAWRTRCRGACMVWVAPTTSRTMGGAPSRVAPFARIEALAAVGWFPAGETRAATAATVVTAAQTVRVFRARVFRARVFRARLRVGMLRAPGIS